MSARIIEALLTAGMLLFLFSAYQGWQTWTINSRPEVEAEVLSAVIATKTRMVSGGRSVRQETRRGLAYTVLYRYEDREYRCKLFDDGWRSPKDYVSLESLKEAMKPGTKVTVLVDPENPMNVRPHRASWEGVLVWFALAVSSMVMAFITGWGTTKSQVVEDIT